MLHALPLRASAIAGLTLAALLCCACSAPSGATAPTAPSSPTPPASPALAAALEHYFAGQFPADEPGGAVLVMKGDRVVFSHAYGLADLPKHEPATTHTLFNVGSVTKPFVATAILQLQEQGKLSVEDSVLTYFPEFKNKDIAARVRLKHLLTHTSGLPDNRNVREDPTYWLTAKDAESWRPITQADALDFEPGSQFAYSNPAYNGLALIIEHITGIKWQTYVRDHVFVPAGMTTSTITDGSHPESGVAHSYINDKGTWREADYGEIPTFAAAGNGGVWSSVEELARFELALRGGVLIKPATLADARTIKTFPGWTSPKPPEVGWSWFHQQWPGYPAAIGHTGHQGGFTASYFTLPDKAIAVEMLHQLQLANWLDGAR